MRFLLGMLISTAAWGQPNPNGDPSPAVQQQQKQAEYAAKGHPQSGKPKKHEHASVRTKGTTAKQPKSKPGEASLRAPTK